jgi:PRC-barrel domain
MRLNFASALLVASLLTSHAVAQSSSSAAPARAIGSDPRAGFAGPADVPAPVDFVARRDPWVLRASDLLGETVFNPGGENVGEVEDVLITRDGRIEALVIEVGGFLDVGERRIAVPPRGIRLDPHGMTATTGTIPSAGLLPDTAAAAGARNDHRISKTIVPERMVLTLPVDQLRNAPAYVDE